MELIREVMRVLPYPSGALGWTLDKVFVRWLGFSPMSGKFARQHGIKDESKALLLVTTGAKSGKPRSVALTYSEIAGRMILVGSKGGAPNDPFWVVNLRANPKATIYVRGRKYSVNTRIAAGQERAMLWGILAEKVPTYAGFQQQISREIPLVLIER
jgi:deazaflavin-dependent oxidoreductase (nitroreductase family)